MDNASLPGSLLPMWQIIAYKWELSYTTEDGAESAW